MELFNLMINERKWNISVFFCKISASVAPMLEAQVPSQSVFSKEYILLFASIHCHFWYSNLKENIHKILLIAVIVGFPLFYVAVTSRDNTRVQSKFPVTGRLCDLWPSRCGRLLHVSYCIYSMVLYTATYSTVCTWFCMYIQAYMHIYVCMYTYFMKRILL